MSTHPSVSIIVTATGQAPHLLECLDSVAMNVRDTPYEVILVLNGADQEVASEVARHVEGARVTTSRVNRGFAGGCNLGATTANGDYLLLLNDDTVVEPDWLESLVAACERRPRIAAVGSRLLHPDGTLQEAGQVLWSDGSTNCVGRDAPAPLHAYEWARRVDYCSGSSLLVRRSTWERLGGLDESYFPAYCEDVDLCLRIAEAGQEVWYEPTSQVRHLESRSSSPSYKKFLIERNRPRLVARWERVLAHRFPPQQDSPAAIADAVHHAMGDPTRVLVVDDRIPVPALGAGFPRMYDFAIELADTGHYHVALLPTFTTNGDWAPFGRAGIEIVREPLIDHLAQPGVRYDVVVISRPNNYQDCAEVIRSALPGVPLVYDVEALFHRRMQKQLGIIADPLERARCAAAADDMRADEMSILGDADLVVCLSEDEASIARQAAGNGKVITKIPFLGGIDRTDRSFEERNDIVLVASWVAGTGSPNVDGLTWFVTEVFPLVQARVPWAHLRITGGSPPDIVRRLAGFGVSFEGHVPDLSSLYDSARCVIVPLRFGSGVKIKTIEALQFGVPVVATSVGAEGIDLHHSGALSIHDDPLAFSDAVSRLLVDEDAWRSQRECILELQETWQKVQARRPSWIEIIECALQQRPAVSSGTSRKSAHAG
ncbi:MAG TPA: glycosyltransferase [Acidimicrobiales bacterium]|nr:glycosyltransferase [Acidimicrobiales bacterium]